MSNDLDHLVEFGKQKFSEAFQLVSDVQLLAAGVKKSFEDMVPENLRQAIQSRANLTEAQNVSVPNANSSSLEKPVVGKA